MSLTPPLPYSPPPRKVCLWHIFFALTAMNGPLPAELKFRENTAYKSWTAGGVLGREALTNYFFGENVLHEIFRL